MRLFMAGLLVAGLLLLAFPAHAQFGLEEDRVGAQPVAALGASWVSFRYSGDADLEEPLFFEGLAPSLTVSVPGLTLVVLRGRSSPAGQATSTDLTDVQFTLWGRWHPFEALSEGATRLYVPIGLHTNYRDATAPQDREDLPTRTFEVTTLAIGAGVGGAQQFGEAWLARARAQPFIGLAQRSFLGGADAAWLLDVDADVVRANVFGDRGLALGYGLRWQHWRLGTPSFQEGPDLHHTGTQHTVRLGLLF